jgi:hypothetical protein
VPDSAQLTGMRPKTANIDARVEPRLVEKIDARRFGHRCLLPASAPDATRNDVDFADSGEYVALTGGQRIKLTLFLGFARLLRKINLFW